MHPLLKRYAELDGNVDALFANPRIQYLIGADWVLYVGNGLCCKCNVAGKSDFDISKITAIRIVEESHPDKDEPDRAEVPKKSGVVNKVKDLFGR